LELKQHALEQELGELKQESEEIEAEFEAFKESSGLRESELFEEALVNTTKLTEANAKCALELVLVTEQVEGLKKAAETFECDETELVQLRIEMEESKIKVSTTYLYMSLG
jgi:hypothetical protein